MQIILALQARTLLSHGCEGFLATIHDTTSDVPSIHDQPIVFEFSDVFPDELPGIPPVRKKDCKKNTTASTSGHVDKKLGALGRVFAITEGLAANTSGLEPISKAPYRIAPIELKEIKDQLQELLERGFIHPSVSP
nr:hypothetical protein [Tanacetum cinerariifolium]